MQIEDANDNAPVFSSPTFSFDVSELADRGAIVGRLSASDDDADPAHSVISYRLVPSQWGGDAFAVDAVTGIVTLAASGRLDREKTAEHYVLTAAAADGASLPLTATAVIYVNVVDENDNPPQLEKALYEVEVAEDTPVGSVIEKIVATDPDEGNYDCLKDACCVCSCLRVLNVCLDPPAVSEDHLIYEIEEMYSHMFSISSMGELSTRMPLDREQEPFYAFRVIVSDNGGLTNGALSATCVVEITVNDVNDHTPDLSDVPRVATVAENSPPSTPVIKISAIDLDEGRNAEVITYCFYSSYHFSIQDRLTFKLQYCRTLHSHGVDRDINILLTGLLFPGGFA